MKSGNRPIEMINVVKPSGNIIQNVKAQKKTVDVCLDLKTAPPITPSIDQKLNLLHTTQPHHNSKYPPHHLLLVLLCLLLMEERECVEESCDVIVEKRTAYKSCSLTEEVLWRGRSDPKFYAQFPRNYQVLSR